MHLPFPLVLGSSSPFRKELLSRLQIPFEACSPNIDESALAGESPQQLVERLSISKAAEIAKSFPAHLIIGSDQVAVNEGKILGKPGTFEGAVEQLSAASGKKVQFYTGLTLLNSVRGVQHSEVVPFAVHFRDLSEERIERYLHAEEPYNCAGSFKSEGLGITLFERLEGEDPSALMGLPLIRLVRMLEQEGAQFP
ncbi:MAG: septum formation inhibitor Maf [Gammaproteobacteria bacterium]|jgi:MAF protein|nr:septum formation inhibitor Maf [Gammaproteobacteria bacterium]MBT3489481.1 septum formation inhibitor Maf [Gammaproteobacteria bacterium]MBT3719604.1 septum formation inhibitor Maf [Gammaproteobacteria bacterium]MBT3844110.1 septum formation inhibitor Maf [Gammaproteobacteria bacterium]MBT3893674.1 septum formation inhibitor Maf [Gammaproteobacteria bacterium]